MRKFLNALRILKKIILSIKLILLAIIDIFKIILEFLG